MYSTSSLGYRRTLYAEVSIYTFGHFAPAPANPNDHGLSLLRARADRLLPVQPLRPGQIQVASPGQRRVPPDLPRGNRFVAAIQGADAQRIAGRLARNGRIDRRAAIRAECMDNPVAAIR